MVVITVLKVPKKLLEVYAGADGIIPSGITLTPNGDGFRKLEVMIQEKMSRYRTRLVLAHELYHCFQHLTDCAMEEKNSNEIDEVMVAALVEKKRRRHGPA